MTTYNLHFPNNNIKEERKKEQGEGVTRQKINSISGLLPPKDLNNEPRVHEIVSCILLQTSQLWKGDHVP